MEKPEYNIIYILLKKEVSLDIEYILILMSC